MKNFFDCKDEKITEKAFSQSLIISIISILLCLVALCSMTYAWFTSETSSSSNTLMSGSFDVTVSITQTNDKASTADGTVIFENGKYMLTEAGTYKVTLIPTEETSVKGYCVVKIDTAYECRTEVIVNDKTKSDAYPPPNSPFIFTIVTDKPNVIVEFEAHWGVPADPVVKKDETISMVTSQEGTENNEASE